MSVKRLNPYEWTGPDLELSTIAPEDQWILDQRLDAHPGDVTPETMLAKHYERLMQKFNQNHDERGRFASGDAGAGPKPSFSDGRDTPTEQDVSALNDPYDAAIYRAAGRPDITAGDPDFTDEWTAAEANEADLSARSGLSAMRVRDFYSGWRGDATNPESVALVQAATEKWGLTNNATHAERLAGLQASFAHGPVTGLYSGTKYGSMSDLQAQARQYVDAQYAHTQQVFADQGVKPDDTITLYRGFARPEGAPEMASVSKGWTQMPVAGRALSSWSTDADMASKFGSMYTAYGNAGYVAATNVKASEVLGTGFTGLGAGGEHEYVVINGNRPAWVRKEWTSDY